MNQPKIQDVLKNIKRPSLQDVLGFMEKGGEVAQEAIKETIKAPIRAVESAVEVPKVLSGGEPFTPINLGPLGELKTYSRMAKDDIEAGKDPTGTALKVGGQAMLEVIGVGQIAQAAANAMGSGGKEVFKWSGGADGKDWAENQARLGPANTVGDGIYVATDPTSSSQFGDELHKLIIPEDSKVYDVSKYGFDFSEDKLYKEMLKDGGSDFIEFVKGKGYDGVQFAGDTGGKWIGLAKDTVVKEVPKIKDYIEKGVSLLLGASTPKSSGV